MVLVCIIQADCVYQSPWLLTPLACVVTTLGRLAWLHGAVGEFLFITYGIF